jgi:hypothetical protein
LASSIPEAALGILTPGSLLLGTLLPLPIPQRVAVQIRTQDLTCNIITEEHYVVLADCHLEREDVRKERERPETGETGEGETAGVPA